MIDDILKILKNLGAKGVGMSSIGPGLYVLGSNLEEIKDTLLTRYSDLFDSVNITYPCNEGMTIKVIR